MNRLPALIKQLILLGLVTIETLFMLNMRYKLMKSEVCNRVFQIYLQENYGISVNLDVLYRSAIKWVYAEEGK